MPNRRADELARCSTRCKTWERLCRGFCRLSSPPPPEHCRNEPCQRVLVLRGHHADWPGAGWFAICRARLVGRHRARAGGRALSDAKAVVATSKKDLPLHLAQRTSAVRHQVQLLCFIADSGCTLFAHRMADDATGTSSAFRPWPWVSVKTSMFSNLSPLLVFCFTPLLRQRRLRRHVYSMMILGHGGDGRPPTVLLALDQSVRWSRVYADLLARSRCGNRAFAVRRRDCSARETGLYVGVRAASVKFLTNCSPPVAGLVSVTSNCPLQGSLRTGTMCFTTG